VSAEGCYDTKSPGEPPSDGRVILRFVLGLNRPKSEAESKIRRGSVVNQTEETAQ